MNKIPPLAEFDDDFDDNPEWTEEDFANAKLADEFLAPEIVAALVRPRGRPALAPEARKQQVTLRLSPDVVAALRATGSGWTQRADAILRDALVGK